MASTSVSTQSSTTISAAGKSLNVMQSFGDLFSSFSKQPVGPENLSTALPMQLSKFGSAGLLGVSAFCSHLSRAPAFFDMHLFLPAMHLPCGVACPPVLTSSIPRQLASNTDVHLWPMISPYSVAMRRSMAAPSSKPDQLARTTDHGGVGRLFFRYFSPAVPLEPPLVEPKR